MPSTLVPLIKPTTRKEAGSLPASTLRLLLRVARHHSHAVAVHDNAAKLAAILRLNERTPRTVLTRGAGVRTIGTDMVVKWHGKDGQSSSIITVQMTDWWTRAARQSQRAHRDCGYPHRPEGLVREGALLPPFSR